MCQLSAESEENPLRNHDDAEVRCSVCLGLLQLLDDPATVNAIVAEVEREGFESDDCFLGVSMPTSILVRQHSTWLFLSESLKL